MDGVVRLDLPGKHNVLLLGGDLEGLVVPLPAKEAGQDLDEAAIGPHEIVVDQARPMHAHLHTPDRHPECSAHHRQTDQLSAAHTTPEREQPDGSDMLSTAILSIAQPSLEHLTKVLHTAADVRASLSTAGSVVLHFCDIAGVRASRGSK